MEQYRIVIFLVLSLVIIFSYPYFMEKMAPPTPPSPSDSQTIIKTAEPSGPATQPASRDNQNQNGEIASLPATASLSPSERSSATQVQEKLKTIETDLYRVVLSDRGGTIKRWELKKHTKKDENGGTHPVLLTPSDGKIAPLELDVLDTPSLKYQTYSLDETPLKLGPNKPKGTVEMKATTEDGKISVTKEITFYNDQYQADIRIVTNGLARGGKGYTLALGSNFGITEWESTMGGAIGAISLINGKVVSEHPEMTTITYPDPATWFALNDKYFMGAIIPAQARAVSVQGFAEKEVSAQVHIPSEQKEERFILYAGPKEYDRLASYHNYLEESIDFGWFIYGSWLPVRMVAKPLFYILRFIYNLTQNYGIAIILLTIFVKAIFHPITRKSLVSMKEMASLQPKVNAIRQKWADNKERMNKELMNLYKETGVNPLGGCMPILLQMPVFIALFNVLYITVDLKGAPFILWISDLSDKDPYYVLPIIMGATMILQQMTQPSTMDPTQAKIMLFMPVIYTLFFLSFPSGLVLYWLVNNILSIGQQLWINKTTAAAT